MLSWQKLGVLTAATMMSVLGVSAGAEGAVEQSNRVAGSSFEVASFNILGSQHTAHSTRWQSGKARAKLALKWLNAEGTTVMGVQEAQRDQMRVITKSGRWNSFPRPEVSRDTQTAQSVAWRSSEWTKLKARTFNIPFAFTQVREQPMVLLKNKHSGERVWFISMHLTSGGGDRAVHERKVGTRRLVRQVRRLEESGVPVIVTGDMNEHEKFFCAVTAKTSLVSPSGGSNNVRCSPPTQIRIDWLIGTPRFRWSNFRFAQDSLLSRITDHTVPVTKVTIPR